MNNHYIAIQKAASWGNNFTMVLACVNEFHMITDSSDTPELAIEAAYANGISHDTIRHFEVA